MPISACLRPAYSPFHLGGQAQRGEHPRPGDALGGVVQQPGAGVASIVGAAGVDVAAARSVGPSASSTQNV
jgi:hypothetical protein